MKLAFYTDAGSPRNLLLVDALRAGGLDVQVFDESKVRGACELHSVVGVVADRALVKALEQGWPYLFWDKGYIRDWPKRWRVSFCGRQPLSFLASAKCPPDRAEQNGWISACRPWRESDVRGHVLFVGAEPRYHAFQDLPDPNVYALQVCSAIHRRTARRIVYRPRPKWSEATAVANASYSVGVPFAEDLAGAHVMVTHGSNACLDALIAGVPSIVLGDGLTRHVSSTDLDDVRTPRIPTDEERIQLLSNLAYTQWTLEEMASGQAWQFIRNHLCA